MCVCAGVGGWSRPHGSVRVSPASHGTPAAALVMPRNPAQEMPLTLLPTVGSEQTEAQG